MEKRIKDYEAFIGKYIGKADDKIVNYHREMLRNFQHERLVHLIIMLFFIAMTVGVLSALFFQVSQQMSFFEILPTGICTALIIVLSVAYVKHYYFLENHIQKLYDISLKLIKKGEKNV